MNHRQRQKEQTRAHILATACQLFSRQGFSASTKDIAAAAGISHGSIFAHFPTKDDLLYALLQDFFRVLGTKFRTISVSGGSMADLLRTHLALLGEQEAFYTRLIAEAHALPGDTRYGLVSLQNILAHHFAGVAQREIREGHIKDIPVHMLFNTWMGLVHYYLQNAGLFSPDRPVLTHCQDQLVDSYLRLINQS